MTTISGPIPKRVEFLDWIRCAAILGMIVHHYHYIPIRVNETNVPGGTGARVSRWVDIVGSFARNTFVALMGISLVLSYQSIRSDDKDQKGVRFVQQRFKRGVILVCAAMGIQLASAILMGERLAIRFGILHFAATIVLLGSMTGAITVEIGRRMNQGFRLFVLGVTVFVVGRMMLVSTGSFTGVHIKWEPRVPLWNLGTGTSIGSTDVHTLDLFTLRKWVPLVVISASITMIIIELADMWSGSKTDTNAPKVPGDLKQETKRTQTRSIMRSISDGVTTISKWGLSIYVWHMILFMFIFFRF